MDWQNGTSFGELLRDRLQQPLPGANAQRTLSPDLSYGRHQGPPAWNARDAAVLIVLYPHDQGWVIPLTLRPAHMVDHAGQISLPGGATDDGESPEECALRECREELGVNERRVELLGRLTPLYIFGSNFLVVPCVGIMNTRPAFQPNPAEVDRVVELEVATLNDPKSHVRRTISRRGVCFDAGHVRCNDEHIWGATGMILGEFREVLRSIWES